MLLASMVFSEVMTSLNWM